MSNHLCLGTAQFGLPYGITNTAGRVAEEEVRRILEFAAQNGIEFLDTAQAYGSAERVLGHCKPYSDKYRLISKLRGNSLPQDWEPSFQSTLKNLRASHLDAFLLHRPEDLRGPHAEGLLNWLESLRSRRLVERIGISIYEASDLEDIPLNRLQIVQLPLSLYDQRLVLDGTVAHLRSKGIAVHARSMLFQGLLLTPADQWPSHLSKRFLEHHHRLTLTLEGRGFSLLDAALSFAKSIQYLEAILLGVQSLNELRELLDSWIKAPEIDDKFFRACAWSNRQDLDPRSWPPQ